MSYSWHNVSSTYSNNTFRYSYDGGTSWTTVIFPPGNYSYDDLNSFIQQTLSQSNYSKSGISLSFIQSRLLVFLTLEPNYQIDLTNGDFSELIGFNKAIFTSSRYGDKLSDIIRSVDDIVIHTNIISKSIVSGKSSDILYLFGISNLPISYPFVKEGRRLLYNKVSVSNISELRIYITDSRGRPVDLNGLPVSMVLLLKTG